MKKFEANKKGLCIILAFSLIILALGISAFFISDEVISAIVGMEADIVVRWIIYGACMIGFLYLIISGICAYLKEKRAADALNNFIEKHGKNAVAIPAIYFESHIEQNCDLVASTFKNANSPKDISKNLNKLLTDYNAVKYAILCNDGIYFIDLKNIGAPEINVFCKRNSLQNVALSVNSLRQIILDCHQHKCVIVLSAKNLPHITHDELLERLNDLYGNMLQTNAF